MRREVQVRAEWRGSHAAGRLGARERRGGLWNGDQEPASMHQDRWQPLSHRGGPDVGESDADGEARQLSNSVEVLAEVEGQRDGGLALLQGLFVGAVRQGTEPFERVVWKGEAKRGLQRGGGGTLQEL